LQLKAKAKTSERATKSQEISLQKMRIGQKNPNEATKIRNWNMKDDKSMAAT